LTTVPIVATIVVVSELAPRRRQRPGP
jgi:hypothetical protein